MKPIPTKNQMELDLNDGSNGTTALDVQVAGDHYKKLKIQPVEYIHGNGIPFIEGCIIKYASRWRGQGRRQRLGKDQTLC